MPCDSLALWTLIHVQTHKKLKAFSPPGDFPVPPVGNQQLQKKKKNEKQVRWKSHTNTNTTNTNTSRTISPFEKDSIGYRLSRE
jgi:hypothetical protein